jgi:hypothetical protein
MKKLISFILLLSSFWCNAAKYYFSNSGNDNTGNGTIGNPYATLNKVNSLMGTFVSGDSILFQCGSVFYGNLIITKGGLKFAYYGTGEKPLITGFRTVTGFSSIGGNIFQASVTSTSAVEVVSINGVLTGKGRYPNPTASNGGYLRFDTVGTNGTKKKIAFPASIPNLIGSEEVYRGERFIINRVTVTAQGHDTITTNAPGNAYTGIDGYGAFFQNALFTLDQNGEWYHNPTANTISIYYSTTLPTIQVATLDNAVYLPSYAAYSNLSFDGISFSGYNADIFFFTNCSNLTVKNCDFIMGGKDAVHIKSSPNEIITGNYIADINNNGINIEENSTNGYVANNTIRRTSLIAGAGQSGDANGYGIRGESIGTHAILNTVINNGYIGISVAMNNSWARNNFVDSFCLVKDDGGGIYTAAFSATHSGIIISGNTVLHGFGNGNGTSNSIYLPAVGIYLDNESNGILIDSNNVAYTAGMLLFLHNSWNILWHDNNFFSGNWNQTQYPRVLLISNENSSFTTIDLSATRNIYVAVKSNVLAMEVTAVHNNIATTMFDISDSQRIMRPIDDNQTIYTNTNLTLNQWKSTYSLDPKSYKSPKTVTSTDSLRFEYNYSNAPVSRSIGGRWMNLKDSTFYSGSITIPAYSSVSLAYVSAASTNTLPVVDAGVNQTITLPTSSVSLSGSATDADGTIASYQWVKTSGGSGTITSPTSASTTVTGLAAGNYVFTLTATDNSGGTGSDLMNVTVNAAPPANLPPVVDAGANQTIQLPTSSITFAGSATDPDGTIVSHTWTKLSGGAATITTPSSYTSTVTGLVAGTYVFTLSATDNSSATSSDAMQVIVQPALNVPPTANAGSNQSTTSTSVVLTGSGTDPDGTITTYAWRNLSSGTATIVSPSSATTVVNNLATGTYDFELKVTDNNGSFGLDTVQVIVSLAVLCKAPQTKSDITVYQNTCQDLSIAVKKKYYWNISGTRLWGYTASGINTFGISTLRIGNYTLRVNGYSFPIRRS